MKIFFEKTDDLTTRIYLGISMRTVLGWFCTIHVWRTCNGGANHEGIQELRYSLYLSLDAVNSCVKQPLVQEQLQ